MFAFWRRSASDDRTAAQVVRFEVTSVATSDLTIPAVSPDGTRVIYATAEDKQPQLYVRALNSLQTTPLPGTVRGELPFFSPNGRSIGFFKDRTLMTLPELLPGGRHLLFTVWRIDDLDHAKVDVLSLDTGEQRTLLEGAMGARYLPTGHLAYLSQSSLFVVGFDAQTMQVRGAPVPVLDVAHSHGGEPFFAVSTGGTLVYHPGSVTMPLTEMAWVSGESEQRVTAPPGYYVDASLSPDDRRLAVAPNYGAHQDIWVHDLVRGTWTRLTTHPGFSAAPVWHPADPNAIVFTTVQPGEPTSRTSRAGWRSTCAPCPVRRGNG